MKIEAELLQDHGTTCANCDSPPDSRAILYSEPKVCFCSVLCFSSWWETNFDTPFDKAKYPFLSEDV